MEILKKAKAVIKKTVNRKTEDTIDTKENVCSNCENSGYSCATCGFDRN